MLVRADVHYGAATFLAFSLFHLSLVKNLTYDEWLVAV